MHPEKEVTTPERELYTAVERVSPSRSLETSPVSPASPQSTDNSKFESAREARRQARRKLLEKMEEEGKLKKEDIITSDPFEAVEKVDTNTEAIPRKKTRTRKAKVQ